MFRKSRARLNTSHRPVLPLGILLAYYLRTPRQNVSTRFRQDSNLPFLQIQFHLIHP